MPPLSFIIVRLRFIVEAKIAACNYRRRGSICFDCSKLDGTCRTQFCVDANNTPCLTDQWTLLTREIVTTGPWLLFEIYIILPQIYWSSFWESAAPHAFLFCSQTIHHLNTASLVGFDPFEALQLDPVCWFQSRERLAAVAHRHLLDLPANLIFKWRDQNGSKHRVSFYTDLW